MKALGWWVALGLLGAAGSVLEQPVKASAIGGAEIDGAGWEGRRLLAQMLWLKTHTVLHAGAEEREALPGEQYSRQHEIHSHGEEHQADERKGHDHKNSYVLVIPPRSEDFRGVLGDVERAFKPYVDPRGRMYAKSPDQTVPFYRLMTWADPHFIQGYTVGAYFMSDRGSQPDVGIDFLLEGARSNPASMEIHTELGHFFLVYKKDYGRAEQHLRKALALVPHGRSFTEDESEAHEDAYRWLGLTYRDWGRPTDALAVAREGLRWMPEDVSLKLIVKYGGRR